MFVNKIIRKTWEVHNDNEPTFNFFEFQEYRKKYDILPTLSSPDVPIYSISILTFLNCNVITSKQDLQSASAIYVGRKVRTTLLLGKDVLY